jgi:RNA polymerase sigma-70 factor (ECF subfamily)
MPLDADAISRLYRAHSGAMLGFFMRRTYEPEAAVDLLAETFAQAFEDLRAQRERP